MTDSPSVFDMIRQELAPRGRIRVALNLGNSVLAQRDAQKAWPSGVSVDLALELGRRLDVPVDLIEFQAAGLVMKALDERAWDVAFLAVDATRSIQLRFTAPYILIEGAYMVKVGSPIAQVDQVDHPGVRLGAGAGSAYELYLARALQHAQLKRSSTALEAFDWLLSGQVDVVAGVRPVIERYAADRGSLRVLTPSFMSIAQAMAIPRRADTGGNAVAYLDEFLRELRSNGFIAASLARSGQTDAIVVASH